MRIIGLDVHRSFAEVAILDRGAIRRAGRVLLEHGRIIEFGKTLDLSDEVVLEATGNTAIIVRLLRPFVRRVVVANPLQVRAIAWAKVKTDKIDAAVLAKLHASGFLPEVWVADEDTEVLRRRVTERTQLVTQMTRLKNRIHAVLHANLIPRYHGKLFAKPGGFGSMLSQSQATKSGSLRDTLTNMIASVPRWQTLKRNLPDVLLKTSG